MLRRIIDEFNALDARAGCIETSEREEVIGRVEELASLVGFEQQERNSDGSP